MSGSIEQSCRTTLEGEVTIYGAAVLKARLLEKLAACRELEIDLAQVVELDSAGLQLLILAKREALAAGKKLRLVNHSHAVLEILDLCGLGDYFGDPLVISPA